MFEPGARVILLTSSSKKKLGPRRGSIGYNIPSKSMATVVNMGGYSVAFKRLDLAFVRYGFSKERKAFEKHTLLNIFPFFLLKNMNDLDEAVACFLKNVRETKEDGKLDHLKNKLNLHTSSNICVAAPVDIADSVIGFNNVNFRAWFEAIVSSPDVCTTLLNMESFKLLKYEKEIRAHILDIKKSYTLKKLKQDLLFVIMNNWLLKKRFIETLIRIVATTSTKNVQIHNNKIEQGFKIHMYAKRGELDTNRMRRVIAEGIFREVIFQNNLDLIQRHCHKEEVFVKSIEKTRLALKKNAINLFNLRSKSCKSELLNPVR